VKIETTSAASLETDSSSSGSSLNVTAAAANLKTRTAAFNGSLGFYTLGVEVQVLGDFALQVRHVVTTPQGGAAAVQQHNTCVEYYDCYFFSALV
jgi:hypothetical protein